MKENTKKLWDENKHLVLGIGGLIVGYKFGFGKAQYQFGVTLTKIWEENPELKDQMWDALTNVCKKLD